MSGRNLWISSSGKSWSSWEPQAPTPSRVYFLPPFGFDWIWTKHMSASITGKARWVSETLEGRYWWYGNPSIKKSSVYPTTIYLYFQLQIHKNNVDSYVVFMNSHTGLIKTGRNLSYLLPWQLAQLPSSFIITIPPQTTHTSIIYILLFWYRVLWYTELSLSHRFFKCNIFQLRWEQDIDVPRWLIFMKYRFLIIKL